MDETLIQLQRRVPSVTAFDIDHLSANSSLLQSVTLLAHQARADELDLAAANAKIQHLRNALRVLSDRLSDATEAVIKANARCAVLEHDMQRISRQHDDQTSGLRSLAAYWEQRWKDERTLRVEAQDDQDSFSCAHHSYKLLNPLQRISSRASRDNSDELDDGTQSELDTTNESHDLDDLATDTTTEMTVYTPHHRTCPEKVDSKQLIVHLASQLESLKTSSEQAIRDRDDQINKLKAERKARNAEIRQMYSALDEILPLATDLSCAKSVQVEQTPRRDRPSIVNSKHASVLDTPEVMALAAGSKRSRKVVQLENEIRSLEQRIRLHELQVQDYVSTDPIGFQEREQEGHGETVSTWTEAERLAETERLEAQSKLAEAQSKLAKANERIAVLEKRARSRPSRSSSDDGDGRFANRAGQSDTDLPSLGFVERSSSERESGGSVG